MSFRRTLISPGSPALYQLSPQRGHIGTVAKMTVGEKNLSKENKTILLVGETGAGKSSLVNTLLNFAMGVKFEDDIWFEIVERKTRSQAESQTSDVIVYEIFDFKENVLPFSLTIIDSRGIEHDDVSRTLLDFFCLEDGVHEVDVVCLVMKATDHRLSDKLADFIFSSVMSLFGKDMEKNIVSLITFSNGREPSIVLEALENANINCARDEKNQPVYFLFNNCQSEDRTEDSQDLEHADSITEEGIKQFTVYLEKNETQKLKTSVEVLNEQVRMKTFINNQQEGFNLIKLTQEALQKHENEMKNETAEVDEEMGWLAGTVRLHKYNLAHCFMITSVLNCTNCQV
uniref:G domain-containing protein n=1 Tax=Echeneis naucrates TaxID=173247 RepID=A0A665TJ24_ECHNA